MDPQQRLFLGVAREAFQDAGHKLSPMDIITLVFMLEQLTTRGSLVSSSNSLFFAIRPTFIVNEPIHGSDFFKTHHSVLTPCISARTAYHTNLHGPNVTLSTACSSSLVAMSIAMDHLRSGKCDMPIVGGISAAFP
jgi:acyl transferase domain-containing protein